MKRFHVHVRVEDLEQSVRFYSGLFGAPPTVHKADYAKWMIEDPRLNFAISQRGGPFGVNHLGLQADSADELGDIRERFAAADEATMVDELGASCCYAMSNKHWVTDPQGIDWEGYHSLGEVRYFDGDEARVATSGCCTPARLEADTQAAEVSTPGATRDAPTTGCPPAAVPVAVQRRSGA
jgi:catechol 2,3-dioxygenase-like lactoylglutathione lyase family enzyme